MDYPHCPAAFINNIADEGTKREAVEWLQKTWNELQVARKALQEANSSLLYGEGVGILCYMDEKSPEGRYAAEVLK